MDVKYFLAIFDIFTYSIGFAALIFGGLVYRKFRDKVNRDYLYFFAGAFITNASYIGDALRVLFKIPASFSEYYHYASKFELGFCVGALMAIYYGVSYIYRASGARLGKMARIVLLGSGLLFGVTDLITVTYNGATDRNLLISLARS